MTCRQTHSKKKPLNICAVNKLATKLEVFLNFISSVKIKRSAYIGFEKMVFHSLETSNSADGVGKSKSRIRSFNADLLHRDQQPNLTRYTLSCVIRVDKNRKKVHTSPTVPGRVVKSERLFDYKSYAGVLQVLLVFFLNPLTFARQK